MAFVYAPTICKGGLILSCFVTIVAGLDHEHCTLLALSKTKYYYSNEHGSCSAYTITIGSCFLFSAVYRTCMGIAAGPLYRKSLHPYSLSETKLITPTTNNVFSKHKGNLTRCLSDLTPAVYLHIHTHAL